MKIKNKLIIAFMVVTLIVFVTFVSARYIINKSQQITITSAPSNVEVNISNTTGEINYTNKNAEFIVTIKNSNDYDVTYTITTTSSALEIGGGVIDGNLPANTSKDVTIQVSSKEGYSYVNTSENANIKVDITKPYKLETNSMNLEIETFNYKMSDLILAQNTVKTTTPDFSENVTTEASSGMYKTTDESGTSYYYRGVIANNYVKFAEKTWRIIRINGDGSYRIILDENIGPVTFSTESSTTYNNIGYMYDTVSNPKGNSKNSNIKTFLESWYSSNIEASYDNYVDKDAIFWQDREVYSTDSNGYSIYKGWVRVVNQTPTLKPGTTTAEKKDWFSVTTTKGNGKLSKPIGMITSDEIMFAGATMNGASLSGYGTYYENNAWYLNLEGTQPYGIWTITPRRFAPSNPVNSHMIVSKPQASLYTEPPYHATTRRYVKPVINLKSTVVITGMGTETDPYVVKSVQ